jgi:hypothetical protein
MVLFRATKHTQRGSEQRPVLQSLTSRKPRRWERKSKITKYIQWESALLKKHPGNQQLNKTIYLSASSCNIRLLSLTLDIYLSGDYVDTPPCKRWKNRPFLVYFTKRLVRLTLLSMVGRSLNMNIKKLGKNGQNLVVILPRELPVRPENSHQYFRPGQPIF